jgi:hypothetical protein
MYVRMYVCIYVCVRACVLECARIYCTTDEAGFSHRYS